MENPFTDISENSFYYTAVVAFANMGIVAGTTETTFSPNGNMTLAECIVFAVRISDRYYGITGDYTAEEGEAWYTHYLEAAQERGLVPEGLTEMNRPITRRNALDILYRILPEEELEPIRACYRIPDVFPSDPMYSEMVQLMRSGVLNGMNAYGTLCLENNLTRAQFVTFLARLVNVSPRSDAEIRLETGMAAFHGDTVPLDHPFQDVSSNSWYSSNVGMLYNLGIVNGFTQERFQPGGTVTLAQAVAVAVRVYEHYHGLTAAETASWNDGYVSLAKQYGILPDGWTNFSAPASREMVAYLAYHTLPTSELKQINSVERTKDVKKNAKYYQEIITLYQAGVFSGMDVYGTFNGAASIKRSELVAIFSRLANPALRKQFTLQTDLCTVETAIQSAISGYTGSWSVYVSDVSTGSSVSINNQRMWAASVVKLYVMGAVMEALENGTLKNSSEIQNELYNMITVSSNDAWISLAKRLGGGNYSAGMSVVNDWARRNGYPDSGRLAGYAHYNTTSAEDAGHFLERILAGTNVSASSSAQMLSLLKAQTRTWKIPAGVPSGVVTANKTGELDEVNNDAAIIFAPYGTYVLVVLTSGGTIADIKRLSSLVYAEMGKCLQ